MSRFVVVGDHRWPIWLDWRGRDPRPRALLFEKIASQRPDLVLDTGDLVPDASERAWRRSDRDFVPLRNLGIPVEAVPGDHETYGWIPRSAQPASRMVPFLKRFPRDGGRRWGRRDFNDIRFLLLDSNVRVLSISEQREQESWLEREVGDAMADPGVALVIAAWHHPPFTNSTTYGDDRFTARSFLPRLRSLDKLGAVFCGHVHGYERFHVESVPMVVTGGGGAHAHRFPADHSLWRHTPAFDAGALPHYHYICVDGTGAEAFASAWHLDLAGRSPRWIAGDSFTIRPRLRTRPT
jgi:3',5'-cyclic AMP phosphodiesterase CpdA